ncbi:MAG TPA: helix-turn-helix domain-containing protein [Rhodanobacteraceae bacterium]|nr:helix-turn-helix domain-containing protein [Rhodanobacteraceae bacterium]
MQVTNMKNATRKPTSESARRSDCPVANALDRVGDKWSLLIVRDMLAGKTTYGQFLESPEGIPTNILSDRLKRMERFGIIKRAAYQKRPVRHDYSLTPEGKQLGIVLRELAAWGLENIAGTKKAILPGSFVSKR